MSIQLYPSIAKIKRNGVYENLPGFVPETGSIATQQMIATAESSATAQYVHNKGEYFRLNDTLYQAIVKINVGDAIVVGTNCEVAVIGNDLTNVANSIAAYELGIATSSHITGDYFMVNETMYVATADIQVGDSISTSTNCRLAVVGDELSELKTHFNGITIDGSIMTLDNIIACGFATTTGLDIPSQTNYWNTGVIWIGHGKTVLKSNYSIYKTAFYDEYYSFINVNNSASANVPIPNNAFYIKVQFANNTVAYANANTVKLYVSDTTTVNPKIIYPNGIEQDNFDEKLYRLINKIDGTGNLQYSGERIKLYNKFDYSLIGAATTSDVQSSAVYGNNIFIFGSTGKFDVYSIDPFRTIKTNALFPNDLTPHCNVAFFGTEFYDANDNYPVLFTNAYNNVGLPKGTCYVFRIANDFTTTLLQTITIGFTTDSIWTDGESDVRPYGNFAADFDSGYLYAYTLKDTSKVTRFFKFNLPTLSDGDVTLTTNDIIEYWDCNYFSYIQDNFCKNGKIYIINGRGNAGNNGYLRVVDTVSKNEVTRINLNDTLFTAIQSSFEPENLSLYGEYILLGHRAIYKLIF